MFTNANAIANTQCKRTLKIHSEQIEHNFFIWNITEKHCQTLNRNLGVFSFHCKSLSWTVESGSYFLMEPRQCMDSFQMVNLVQIVNNMSLSTFWNGVFSIVLTFLLNCYLTSYFGEEGQTYFDYQHFNNEHVWPWLWKLKKLLCDKDKFKCEQQLQLFDLHQFRGKIFFEDRETGCICIWSVSVFLRSLHEISLIEYIFLLIMFS